MLLFKNPWIWEALRRGRAAAMTKVTIAPITSIIKGLSSEVPVGGADGLDSDGVISLDNVVTVRASYSAAPWGF